MWIFCSVKNSSDVIEKFRETFRVLQYLFRFFYFKTHLCHMILSEIKVLSLVKFCFNRESKTYRSVLQIMRDFSRPRNTTRMHVGLSPSLWIFYYFPHGKYTGCFINSVTILNLYIIKISTLNCLTSKYYKNIMICILFGIKIDPYFHNLGLLYENFKKGKVSMMCSK